MNNLKQYKEHFGGELATTDNKLEYFQNSNAITKMFAIINELQQQLSQKEKVIKEAIEYIKNEDKEQGLSMYVDTWKHLYKVLSILEKENN